MIGERTSAEKKRDEMVIKHEASLPLARRGKCELVYFFAVNEESRQPLIKIGFTEDYEKRLRQHTATKLGVSVDIRELCAVRGNKTCEQSLKEHFKRYRLNGENEIFKPVPEVLDYIRWLRDQYYAWVPDDHQCERIDMHDVVPFDQWKPGPGRTKSPPRIRGLFNEYGSLMFPPRELTVDDFYTDERIIECARKTMGAIDLDPASHPLANRVVKAKRFYNIHDNGLEKEWSGCVWLNPPFSQWRDWSAKVAKEWESGHVDQMCILAATRTITAKFFAPIQKTCDAVCIFNGRIPFWGGLAASPDEGHCVFYFGGSISKFQQAFSELGFVYLRNHAIGH